MQRRDLLKQTALTLAAFTLSRDLFAAEAEKFAQLPDVDKIIKLSSNENPHGPSPMARKQMMEAVNGSNRYPWDVTTKLREEIAALTGHTKEHIVMGAGSSELLGLVAVWAALKKGNAVAPDPTFRLWMPAARKTGLDIKLVPLTDKKMTDLQRMKEAMNDQTKLVYICNPNNPTGTVLPAKELEAFIKDIAPKAIILLDEAYTEFSSEPSMAHLVNDYPNLVIAKTFSKIYGMAGARVGYALAHPTTIKQLNELQPWANAGASAVSLAGALAALKDKTFIDFCKKENALARSIFCKALDKAGIPYIPSETSFIYFDTSNFGKDVKAMLEAKGIVGARTFEEGTKWLRISVGTQDEMKKAAAALLS
ncbi:pyridoxal phosphate-dependent aminotransferase [Lacibacter sediminis]|uniref:Histidinol-phosphate aminotransferase family protein n=1 Tax=Lacibacter sediminis TaxID=2760713 RepID=A0A7G5XJ19_9BACT|nr:histidinol-phosphate transaminase [Lacibacter sediminis]QNA45472.1 histidinol-phosphate aminotransferase family protein [Lacibacter sediminis]